MPRLSFPWRFCLGMLVILGGLWLLLAHQWSHRLNPAYRFLYRKMEIYQPPAWKTIPPPRTQLPSRETIPPPRTPAGGRARESQKPQRSQQAALSGDEYSQEDSDSWSRHASPGQYERLRHYHGSYGWGEIDRDVVLESLSLLNSSANGCLLDDRAGRPRARCAVVGNGGILCGARVGAQIDGHHYVFRTNGAITKGFEQDVGNRTSFFIFSTNTLMNSLYSYRRHSFLSPPQSPETRYVFLPEHDRDYLLLQAAIKRRPVDRGKDRLARPERFFGPDLKPEKFKMLHPDFMRYLKNRLLPSKHAGLRIYRQSTGATMLLAALHTCDEVSAYGFITPNYARFSDHYFDGTPQRVVFYSNHDLRLEMELWQRLHQAGLIRLLMREPEILPSGPAAAG
ncbi:alpha-N-acetylgalactosaminide alpha-2,6-sialyltransferase 2-like isoform X2 [Tachyglossus aculeatus]|uniref:alpha-N-acetylgalactosaminide alpha-2,6-sialyltransferase 2-like isoform X2 n=1 Tax=Tachyglossus aculeatus TaxID=9261 RepID=UPI0018F5ED75|nr:alpha-N-acetylgalactosaminide alpha-2,6-sialyltransferase 2-like isoform X2 [Tachyglossus aculeatus]